MSFVENITNALQKKSSKQKALNCARFFRTAPGQYGAGDVFIGVTVPEQRKVARQFYDAPLIDLHTLLQSKIHEHRLTALHILVLQFQKAVKDSEMSVAQNLYCFYIDHTAYINNWDLVDASAPYIVGGWLVNQSIKTRRILHTLVYSKNLWERRIAIVSTWMLIRNRQYKDTLAIAKILLRDSHDLIHKATGWMLREVGKRDQATLIKFLDKHAPDMPRTALRYAIEKLTPRQRKLYLAK